MTALSKTDQADATDAADATDTAETAETADGAAYDGTWADDAEPDDGSGPDDDEAGEPPPAARAPSGVAAGAAAVVGAALGFASLTGTWLADLVSARRELTGQLESANGTAAEQISAAYGAPWHTIALFNGLTAVVALIVSAAVLVRPAFGDSALRPVVWVRAVAVAGLVLGALGLVIAAVMRFDVFADLPTVPGQ
ncbi:hypothetical protein ACXZ65_16420 [Streptomyces aculeolatus]